MLPKTPIGARCGKDNVMAGFVCGSLFAVTGILIIMR